MFKITFADSSVLDNLSTNGSYFLTDTEINEGFFAGKLSNIFVEGTPDNDGSMPLEPGKHSHCELISTLSIDGKYAFAIREIPPEKFAIEKLNADVTYLAMMTDNIF